MDKNRRRRSVINSESEESNQSFESLLSQYNLPSFNRENIKSLSTKQKNIEELERKLKELDEDIKVAKSNFRSTTRKQKDHKIRFDQTCNDRTRRSLTDVEDNHRNHHRDRSGVDYDLVLNQKKLQLAQAIQNNPHLMRKGSATKPKSTFTQTNQVKSSYDQNLRRHSSERYLNSKNHGFKSTNPKSNDLFESAQNKFLLVTPEKIEMIQNKVELIKSRRKMLDLELIKAEESLIRNMKALELKKQMKALKRSRESAQRKKVQNQMLN